MGSKSRATKRLRTELAEVCKEIDKRIVRLDELSAEIKRGYEGIESVLADKQALAEAKFRKSLMSSGEDVWNYAWDSVWDAVKAIKIRATTENEHDYQALEPALLAKQASLKGQLHVSEMFVDQVWTDVWTAVWIVFGGINDEYRRAATAEIGRIGAELQPLLDQQLALQTEIEELSKSANGLW
jgi:hypothetical protein